MDDKNFDICPYNPIHRVHKSQILKHINTCRLNYPDIKLKTCPYNKTHILSSIQYEHHLTVCEDRVTDRKAYLLVPTENLDESRPSTSYQHSLDSHDKTSPIDSFQSFRNWRLSTSELKKTKITELPKFQFTSPIEDLDEWPLDSYTETCLIKPSLPSDDFSRSAWSSRNLQLPSSPKTTVLFKKEVFKLSERLEKSLVLKSTPASFSSSGVEPSSTTIMSRKRRIEDTKDIPIAYPSTSTKPDVAKKSKDAKVEMKGSSSSEYVSKQQSKLIIYHGETIFDFTDDSSNDSHNSQQSGNSQQEDDTRVKNRTRFSSEIDEDKYKRRRK